MSLEVEGHGREEIAPDLDISRTVGWFTTLYPVVLEIPSGSLGRPVLQGVKEQLRRVPHRGLGYGLLRYLRQASPDEAKSTSDNTSFVPPACWRRPRQGS